MNIDWTQWLIAELSKRFELLVGPPRAYFEVPCGLARETDAVARVTYIVWGLRIEEVGYYRHRDLAELMLQRIDEVREFENLTDPEYRPLWFWRRLPEIGDHMDLENESQQTKLTMRFAVPGYDFSGRVINNPTCKLGSEYAYWSAYVPDGNVIPTVIV